MPKYKNTNLITDPVIKARYLFFPANKPYIITNIQFPAAIMGTIQIKATCPCSSTITGVSIPTTTPPGISTEAVAVSSTALTRVPTINTFTVGSGKIALNNV